MYIRRKVYSNADYNDDQQFVYEDEDNEALYSNDAENEDDEPRFYSVIMSEDELALFSDFQEYLYSEDNASSTAAVLGGLGAATALGAGVGGVYTANKALNKEGGIKGVFKTAKESKKKIMAEDAAQAKLDKKNVNEIIKNKQKYQGLKKGKATTEARKQSQEMFDKVRKEATSKKLAEAEGAFKGSLKKGWEAVKGNKKLRYAALGAGALGVGGAAMGLGGKLNKND